MKPLRLTSVVALVVLSLVSVLLFSDTPAQAQTAPLQDAIDQLDDHVRGINLLSATELDALGDTIDSEASSATPDMIGDAYGTIQTYETRYGPLFTDDGTKSFSSTASGLEPTMHQLYLAVFDAIDSDLISSNPGLVDGLLFRSHEYFPGVASAPTSPNAVFSATIHASVPLDWGRPNLYSELPARRPTGTYLAPGTIAEVTVPAALVNTGYEIRVGAHSWDLSNKPNQKRIARATKVYPITSQTVQVANPLGGGIYIEVPHLADDGFVEIQIKNVVESPYFSARSFDQTTSAEWSTERALPGPWTDIETDQVMMQVPSKWIRSFGYDEMMQILNAYDANMNLVSDLMGKPHLRNKTLWYMHVDVDMRGGSFFPGYPMGNYAAFDSPTATAPLDAEHAINATGLHEHGHATFITKFLNESEAIVHIFYTYVADRRYAMTLDQAFSTSLHHNNRDDYMRDDIFPAWALSDEFANNQEMEFFQAAYQHAGYADYVDYVDLFGWSAFGDFNKQLNIDYNNDGYSFADKNKHPVNDRVLRLSRAAGADVTPLFHLWGHPPLDEETLAATLQAEGLGPSAEIRDLMLGYRDTIPTSQAEFNAWYANMDPVLGDYNGLWTELQSNFDPARAEAARDRIDYLVDQYFNDGPGSDQLDPPPGGGWELCAREWYACEFDGEQEMAFGQDPNWAYKFFTDGQNCTTYWVGDPSTDAPKTCWTRQSSPSGIGWELCANDGEQCSFTGTQEVAYGTGDTWTVDTHTNGTACSSDVFEDPAEGQTKKCWARAVLSPPPGSGWVPCATANSLCSFNGTLEVAFGVGDKWNYADQTNGAECSRTVFADPAPGQFKHCWYRIETTPPPGTGWVPCATANNRCAFIGSTHEVAFGVGTRWKYAEHSNGTDCSVTVFGDPASGQMKDCWMRPVVVDVGGDVDCDAELTIGDALMIAQYTVGLRAGVMTCPLADTATELYFGSADVDDNDSVDIGDALLIAQCTVGLVNTLCPE